MRPEVSIIVPAFDEQARLGESLLKIGAYVTSKRISAEIIVVDDGSRDSTEKVAIDALAAEPEIPTQMIRYKENRGKGFAVRTGLMAARSDIALFSDADLSTPIEEMHKLTDPIKAGEFDVTFGSRALDRTLIGTHQPWRREQGGKVVNFIIKTMSGLPFADTQCGFKAFNMRKFGPLLDVMTIDRFGFDVEFLYVANYHDLRLKEIPVRWDNVEGSKVSVVRDTRRMFFELNQIRRNVKRGNYDLPSDIETAESSATSV